MSRRLLTPKEIEAEYGISNDRLQYWRKKRIGPEFIRDGYRTVWYDQAAFEEYLARNTHVPSVRATIEEKRVHL